MYAIVDYDSASAADVLCSALANNCTLTEFSFFGVYVCAGVLVGGCVVVVHVGVFLSVLVCCCVWDTGWVKLTPKFLQQFSFQVRFIVTPST